jgi:predicted phage terminase large subunit-like protein
MNVQKELIINALKKELFNKSFYHFLKEFWPVIIPDDFVDNWHIKYLCDELQIIGFNLKERNKKLYDLIINIPPSTSKSTICTIMFPAWLWTIDPTIRIISGSFAKSLSLDHSVKTRNILQSEEFKKLYPDLSLASDNNNKGYYLNNMGGSRISTSVDSGIIGQHGHLLIVDDPLQSNPSDTDIDNASNWITNTLFTRKIDKEVTPLILIMQRVHPKDPTGTLLDKNKDKIKHICLPAELTDDLIPIELSKNYIDGLLDIKRLNRDTLLENMHVLGSYEYSSQFLQAPNPKEGGIINRDWITVKDLYLDKELINQLNKVPVNFYLDTAYTEKSKNDPSAIIAVKKLNNKLYLMDCEEVRLEFPDLIKFIKGFLIRNNYTPHSKIYIEPKASGKSVYQVLKDSFNIMEDDAPTDSKAVRLKACSPVFESGKVIFNDGKHVNVLITQLINLKTKHDDLRDCLVMAIKRELINNTKGQYTIR